MKIDLNSSRQQISSKMICMNCGHPVVELMDSYGHIEYHHVFEFIDWSDKIKDRKLRCDSYKEDGKTSCGCENPMTVKARGLQGKILREMLVSKESD